MNGLDLQRREDSSLMLLTRGLRFIPSYEMSQVLQIVFHSWNSRMEKCLQFFLVCFKFLVCNRIVLIRTFILQDSSCFN